MIDSEIFFSSTARTFYSYERISMKLLFCGKTLGSDEPKYSKDLFFRDFPIDTKIVTRKI